MNPTSRQSFNRIVLMLMLAGLSAPLILHAQPTSQFEFDPPRLELAVGDTAEVSVRLLGEDGAVHADAFMLFTRGRSGVEVMSREVQPNGVATTKVVAHQPGSYALTARTLGARDTRVTGRLAVEVAYPPLAKIEFVDPPSYVYTGTTTALTARVIDGSHESRITRSCCSATAIFAATTAPK